MSTLPPANPFYFGGKITDPARFVGRTTELRFITQRMEGVQMTSVGIVGDRRIGKSSLLYHIYQTYPQRLTQPQHFLVGYVSLQDARVRTHSGFLKTLGGELAAARDRHPAAASLPAWPTPCQDLITFGQCLQAMKEANLHCVLCLDEFEALLEARQEFNDPFYDALRAWMDDQLLMLIVASSRPLNYYGSRYRHVSRFFNLGNTCYLLEFSDDEARRLVRMPALVGIGTPALGTHDQELALELGKRHPFLLQMAAHFVYEAHINRHDEQWVRAQLRQQVQSRRPSFRHAGERFLRLLCQAPEWLGRAAGRVGAFWDSAFNRLVGVMVIVLVVLVATGLLRPELVWKWLVALVGLAGSTE